MPKIHAFNLNDLSPELRELRSKFPDDVWDLGALFYLVAQARRGHLIHPQVAQGLQDGLLSLTVSLGKSQPDILEAAETCQRIEQMHAATLKACGQLDKTPVLEPLEDDDEDRISKLIEALGDAGVKVLRVRRN